MLHYYLDCEEFLGYLEVYKWKYSEPNSALIFYWCLRKNLGDPYKLLQQKLFWYVLLALLET